MKIGITGATGHLGRLVVDKLKKRIGVKDIVALARSPQKAAGLGVETREADYDRPETLAKALQGVDTLLLISASEVGQRARQHRNVVDAAKEAGVRRIVYTSLLNADRSTIPYLADEHRASEEAVKGSGIPYTILRNGWYTENYAASIPGALKGGAFLGSAGEGKISSASREDYADAAVAVLTSPGHEGKVYELAGDRSFTLRDLAAEVSRQSGQSIPYRNLPEAEYASVLQGFGLPEGMAKAYAAWDTSASRDALYDDRRQLSTLIGHPTTPMAATVTDTLKRSS